MNDDLVNRLRTQNSMLGYYDAPNIQTEAADRIEQLEAALRPFAELADQYDPDDGDGDERTWFWLAQPKIGWLRNARAALEGKDAPT